MNLQVLNFKLKVIKHFVFFGTPHLFQFIVKHVDAQIKYDHLT